MKKYTYLILFALFCGTVKAQVTFTVGYLINAKGDTLQGEVKINPKKDIDNYSKIFFKDANNIQKNYKPNKVKGYGFNGRHFVSYTEKDESMFCERLTSGAIILYKSSFEAGSAGETTKELIYYLYKDGDKKLTEVKESKFKKQIMEWMSGSAGLANDYEDGKKFNEASAIEIINKYNEWKSQN
ncbi:MAG: hypothetical protein IPM51_13970 [Sphingobacteriaceae bacterium]|nr:hypothetical protein [Sphingobacteriaceae bacterium]